MNKRIGITCIIIAVSTIVLVTIILIGGLGIFLWGEANPQPTITSAHNAINPLCGNEPCPTTSTQIFDSTPIAGITSFPTTELPAYITKAMDQIQIDVVAIRGLTPTNQVPRALLTPSELEEKVVSDFLADYSSEEAHGDGQTLFLMGLLPANFNLIDFYQKLFSEQIAGYYDDESKEMYVVRGNAFDGPEKMTYAHEFTHVLQDQTYDLRNGLKMNDENCMHDSERCAAISALVEGDASLTEFIWLYTSASDQDRNDIQDFYQSYISPVYDSAPDFMKEDFLFPYQYGQEFVQVLYDDGGWTSVDNAYMNPPVSTEQIIHPDRYPNDIPQKVILPDISTALGNDWLRLENDTVGEWYTYLILSAGYDPITRLDLSTAYNAATGWGGDAYQVYENPITHQSILIVDTSWDTTQDAREFFQAFQDYGTKRWGIAQSPSTTTNKWETRNAAAQIAIEADRTLIIIAPNTSFIDLITRALIVF